MTYEPARTDSQAASFSIPSIIAIVCALISLFVGAIWSILLALVAIVAGFIGAAMALSPSRRGGIMSIAAIVISALAIVLSLISLILRLVTG